MSASDASPFTPVVSIGVAVYNGELTLSSALDSLLSQTFVDFEIIISDNASTDRTADICQSYCAKDRRIRYIRQDKNRGAAENFKFVLEQSSGRYFMWAAADDIRSPDFLWENVIFLNENSDCVASTSPNCYEGQESSEDEWVVFGLDDESSAERVLKFFQHCWQSHAIYYSLMRTEVAKACGVVGKSFIAADWAFNLFLLLNGKVHRLPKGLTVLGCRGVSSQPGAYRRFRNQSIELFLPFYRLSGYVLKLSKGFSVKNRILIVWLLAKLNFGAVGDQCHSYLYQSYRRFREMKR